MVFMMRRNLNASSSSSSSTAAAAAGAGATRKPDPQPPRQKKLSFREPEVVASPRGGKSRTVSSSSSSQVTSRVSAPDSGRTDELGLDDEQLQVTTRHVLRQHLSSFAFLSHAYAVWAWIDLFRYRC